MKKNYYDLLNVPKNASEKDIKKAYKKLASKYHPDKNVGKSKEEITKNEKTFKEISEAYEVLSNPEKRKEYDLYGETESFSQHFSGSDFKKEDFFNFGAEDFMESVFSNFKNGFNKKGNFNFSSKEEYAPSEDEEWESLKKQYGFVKNRNVIKEFYLKQGYYFENNVLTKDIFVPFSIALNGGSINIELYDVEFDELSAIKQKTIQLKIKPNTKHLSKLNLKNRAVLEKDKLEDLHLKVHLCSDEKYLVNEENGTVKINVEVPVLNILMKKKMDITLLNDEYHIDLNKFRPNVFHAFNSEKMNIKVLINVIPTFEVLDRITDKDLELLSQINKTK